MVLNNLVITFMQVIIAVNNKEQIAIITPH